MIARMQVSFLVLALFLALAESTSKNRCGPNEVYNSCGSLCATTCKTRFKNGATVCPALCVPGCGCIEGYLKHDNGTCVPPSECSPPTCNDDEQYSECGTACQINCDNKDNTCLICTKECVQGCFCKEGTIRESADSFTCIKPKSCPVNKCTGVNEIKDGCPPSCPPQVCAAIWSSYKCPNEASNCCEPQCRCKPGYYRNSSNVCISTQKCIDTRGTSDKY